jgi:hypothetical protein
MHQHEYDHHRYLLKQQSSAIFCQILLNFFAIVNNPDWVHWYEGIGGMQLLHWYSNSFLEQIFNCFASFAPDFGNGKVMSESCLIAKLNTKALVCAITVMKTFCDQIKSYQATMPLITVMPWVVVAYTVSPWNNTQACGTKKDKKNSTLTDGASVLILITTQTLNSTAMGINAS